MKTAVTSSMPTAFDEIFSDTRLFPRDQPSTSFYDSPNPIPEFATIDSPHLIRRASKTCTRPSLGFHRLLRPRWNSMSSIDSKKSEELRILGKCVNSNAEAEAMNAAMHRRLAVRHDAIIEPRTSEHLYAVDELPAEHEHEDGERDSYFRDSEGSMAGSEDSTPDSTLLRQYAHTHTRSNSGSSFRNRASPAAHSFAFAQRRRPSLSIPRSLSFANGPPPNPAVSAVSGPVLIPTDTFNFNIPSPGSPTGIYSGPVSSTTTITANPSSHTRSRSLPHMGGLSGQLRTPQKMKKPTNPSSHQRSASSAAVDTVTSIFSSHSQSPSSERPIPTTATPKATGLRKLTMKTPRTEEPGHVPEKVLGRRHTSITRSSGLPIKIPKPDLGDTIVYSPTSPDIVHGINLFGSAASGWSGGVTVTTETTTTVSNFKEKRKRRIMENKRWSGRDGGGKKRYDEVENMKGVMELATY